VLDARSSFGSVAGRAGLPVQRAPAAQIGRPPGQHGELEALRDPLAERVGHRHHLARGGFVADPGAELLRQRGQVRSARSSQVLGGIAGGVTIYDDFAHHPTAIAGTLTALRSRYPGSRLWVILEPRSNTLRRNVFQHELTNSLALADEVVVAGVFKSDAIPPAERLDLMAVGADLQQRGTRARIISGADGIVQVVAPELRRGDVVAILSNGGFDGIYEKLPARLKEFGAGSAASSSKNPLGESAKA